MKPASNTPRGRSTRYASRHTGRTSGTNEFKHGWTIRSKLASSNGRSAMSPSTVVMLRPSRSATIRSCPSWRGELSSTVTRAPAAARTGPCWPPPEARASTSRPLSGGNQARGTGRVGVSRTSHSPRRAAAMVPGETGTVQRLPFETCWSQAWRLSERTSAGTLLVHRLQELLVGLGVVHLVDEELHRFDRVQLVEELAQDPHPLEHLGRHEQLLLARSRAVDVDRREDALVRDLAVEHELRVTGALELLEDDLVHARAGLDQRGRDDGERSPVLDVARGAEEALGALERVSVHAAREDLARVRHH